MAWADVNGARLYYEVAGEGHPLVLIHAGIADSRMWDDQVAALIRPAARLRCAHAAPPPSLAVATSARLAPR